MNTKAGLLAAAMMTVIASSSFAHHSAVMFDFSKRVTLAGTVREFQFTNPHCFIQLMVPDTDAEAKEWSIEMASPAHLLRSGWKPNTLKAGERITVTFNPAKDGSPGGNFVSVLAADGKEPGAIR